ncbi:MAG: GDSL-type esterase/lipase family protein [Verrucomicrobiales bacterium]|nr:GDSL-type esterase/lipase family protein [Verrucomicrobiales bacterium]
MKAIFLTLIGITAIVTSSAEPIRVACVGDSITFGAGIRDRQNKSYPAQLSVMLGDSHVVKNFGNSGSTLLKKGDKPYWKQREFAAAVAFEPHVVIIKLGTNDTKPQNWKHGSDFASDYKDMITTFRSLKSKPQVYVCLPVPVFKTRWGITDKIINENVIPATKAIAKQTGAKLIDLNTPLKGKAALVPDSVHPNAGGARIMAETIAQILKADKTSQ